MTRKRVTGEERAVWWLRRRGWRILDRNWRRPGGEIDVVARRGDVLAFCEIKARGDGRWLMEPLRPVQARRLALMTERYLWAHPELAGLTVRIDVIAVAGRGPLRRVHRIPAAVEADAAAIVATGDGVAA